MAEACSLIPNILGLTQAWRIRNPALMSQFPLPFGGHCLCGAVTYTCDAQPLWQSLCHCESCRRATSSPFTAFFGMADGHWRWTGQTPVPYASSPGVQRDFCPHCGAQMAYRSHRFPGEVHFYAASLDDPAKFIPQDEVFAAEALAWAHQPRLPHQAHAPYDWQSLLTLIRRAFAGMEGRIDPPSSDRQLSVESLATLSKFAEIWAIGSPPIACMILTRKPDRLYLGKLAVDPAQQGRGLARKLIQHAETRARALGLPRLELQARVELTENHALFQHLGFVETARTAHPGFDRPTSITFTKDL